MKDTVLKESYVERFAREQKEKRGIPARAESAEKGTPEEAKKNIHGEKEGKKHGKNTRGKGQATSTE